MSGPVQTLRLAALVRPSRWFPPPAFAVALREHSLPALFTMPRTDPDEGSCAGENCAWLYSQPDVRTVINRLPDLTSRPTVALGLRLAQHLT